MPVLPIRAQSVGVGPKTSYVQGSHPNGFRMEVTETDGNPIATPQVVRVSLTHATPGETQKNTNPPYRVFENPKM